MLMNVKLACNLGIIHDISVLDDGEEIKDCIWANDKTNEYCVQLSYYNREVKTSKKIEFKFTDSEAEKRFLKYKKDNDA